MCWRSFTGWLHGTYREIAGRLPRHYGWRVREDAARARMNRWATVAASFLGRRVLARAIRADLEACERLPSSTEEQRKRRRSAILFASIRLHGAEEISRTRIKIGSALFSGWIATLSTISTLQRAIADYVPPSPSSSTSADGSPPAETHLGTFNAWILGVAAAAVCVVIAGRLARRHPRVATLPGRTLAAQCALPGLSFSLSSLPFRYARPHSDAWHFWTGWYLVCGTVLMYFVIAASFGIPIAWRVARRCRPLDRLLLMTTVLAADIHTLSRRRLSPTDNYLLCRRLEGLALVAERDLTMPHRGPRSVRRELRRDALRVAAVYRSHRLPLTTAAGPQDADRIVASLVAAIEALATANRTALLANAPENVPERNLIRRILARAWPASLFVASGALLPLIPPIAHQPSIASSLRWSLIVAGVLTFVAGQDTVSRIGTPLDKALPWK
jgi:hypothetical protein